MHVPCRSAAIRLESLHPCEEVWWVLTLRCLQGVSLILSSYQQWRYHPEGGSLSALAANMRQRLAAFRNSELATCMEALSALGFHPGNDLVQVHSLPAMSLERHAVCTSLAMGAHALRSPELWQQEHASACKLLLCGEQDLSLLKGRRHQLLLTVGMCRAGTGCKGWSRDVASLARSGSGESQGAGCCVCGVPQGCRPGSKRAD